MKIAYINGYKGEKSKKYSELSKILNINIDHIVYKYSENNIDEIKEQAKDYDIIIASSTGAYIARDICFELNIPLISLNPVIDIFETFGKIGEPAPNIKPHNFAKVLEEIVFLNKDDELVDYNKSKELFDKKNTWTVSFNKGTHRFNNLVDTKDYIFSFLNKVYS